MQINRSEARYKAMTILYQINLYQKNNIDYILENCKAKIAFIKASQKIYN